MSLEDAIDEGLLAINPAEKAKKPTPEEAAAPEMKYWQPAELAAFLTWAKEHDSLYTAWALLGATGMRRGELLALRWLDVDLERGTVAIRRNAVLVHDEADDGSKERIVVKKPKGGKTRVVDIDPRTVAVLKAQKWHLAEIDLRWAKPDALIVPADNGGIRHPERFSREFVRRLARARKVLGDQVPEIRLHDIRHSHATTLLIKGVHPKVVQERLGHANVSITIDRYSHVIPSMQKDAAELFATAVYGT